MEPNRGDRKLPGARRSAAAGAQRELTLRRATPDDLDGVLTIVRDASRRLEEKGLPDWRRYLTPAGFRHVQDRVNGLNDVEVYLAWREGDETPVGVFSIEWSDRQYWDAIGEDGQAGYIHMLAVHRSARGSGVGRQMVGLAEKLIARRGRRFARLDCGAYNAFLCGYYRALGYRSRGIKHAPHAVMRFEKALVQGAR